MKLYGILIAAAMLMLPLFGLQATADEVASTVERLEGKVQRIDIKRGNVRIAGETYRLSPDVEVMDSREGGTVELRSIRVGSLVEIKVRHGKKKRQEIIYLEVHDMPLK